MDINVNMSIDNLIFIKEMEKKENENQKNSSEESEPPKQDSCLKK